MGIVRTVAPTIEPITEDEAKAFIGEAGTDSLPLVVSLIQSARERCEKVASRSLITQTYKWTMESWPSNGVFRLPYPPLLTVTSIKYYDVSNVQQTVSSALYQVDTTTDPGTVRPVFNQWWPSAQYLRVDAIEVIYTAGYGATAATVPAEIKERLKNYVAYCFDHRFERDEAWLDSLFDGFFCGDYGK